MLGSSTPSSSSMKSALNLESTYSWFFTRLQGTSLAVHFGGPLLAAVESCGLDREMFKHKSGIWNKNGHDNLNLEFEINGSLVYNCCLK